MSKVKSSLVMVKIRWDNSDRKCVNLIKPIGTMKNEAQEENKTENSVSKL